MYLLPTEAEVGLGELRHWVVMTTLGTRPEHLLVGKELWREKRQLLLSIPGPLLDALEVEQTVALDTAPYLVGGEGGGGRGEGGGGGDIGHRYIVQ